MASLYQRFTGKINTSRSFPAPPEASRLLGGQGPEEDGAGPKPLGAQAPAAAPRERGGGGGAGGRPRFQYQARSDCDDEDVRASWGWGGGGGNAGLQASPGETRPRGACEGLGAPSPPPLLPEARPQNHSLRGSRSPPSWSGSRSAAAAGQELVALRAALAELRCWGVELAEGSRRPWGRLLLPARCYGS